MFLLRVQNFAHHRSISVDCILKKAPTMSEAARATHGWDSLCCSYQTESAAYSRLPAAPPRCLLFAKAPISVNTGDLGCAAVAPATVWTHHRLDGRLTGCLQLITLKAKVWPFGMQRLDRTTHLSSLASHTSLWNPGGASCWPRAQSGGDEHQPEPAGSTPLSFCSPDGPTNRLLRMTWMRRRVCVGGGKEETNWCLNLGLRFCCWIQPIFPFSFCLFSQSLS